MNEEKPGTTGDAVESGAEDDLDAVLSEFDQAAPETKSEPKSEAKTDTNVELLELLKSNRERELKKDNDKDLSEAVKSVKGEAAVDDDIVEAWLDGKARKDERVRNAWLQRHQNPAAFKRVLAGLSTELSEKFTSKVDRNATESEEAVRAAVRSASTRQTDTKPMTRDDWRKMSPEERRKAQSDHGVRPV